MHLSLIASGHCNILVIRSASYLALYPISHLVSFLSSYLVSWACLPASPGVPRLTIIGYLKKRWMPVVNEYLDARFSCKVLIVVLYHRSR